MRLMIYSVLLATMAKAVTAANPMVTGKEYGLWTEGHYNVIIATIHDIRPIQGPDSERNWYRSTLKPIATLAGALDPSSRAAFDVRFIYGTDYSHIRKLPSDGATVLTVVTVGIAIRDEKDASDFIEEEMCIFMPDRSGLVELDGIQDSRVIETLKRIQDARAHADPSPYPSTAPTTKPEE